MKREINLLFLLLLLGLGRSLTATAQIIDVSDGNPYVEDFEGSTTFSFENNTSHHYTNQWYIGTAASHGGQKGLYITEDGGNTNTYEQNENSMVFAYVPIDLGNGKHQISYDWRGKGDRNNAYLRVALVPNSEGNTIFFHHENPQTNGFGPQGLPAGWIALDGGSQLAESSVWRSEMARITISEGGYYLVFAWRTNKSNSFMNPAAGIDNVRVEKVNVFVPEQPVASNITAQSATITWTDTYASTWNIRYKKTTQSEWNTISSVSQNTYTLTGLDSGTKYEVQVQAVDGIQQSPWTVSTVFHTAVMVGQGNPYEEGFEGSTLFQFSNSDVLGAKWHIGTAAHHGTGSTKGLYISDDDGATNSYINSYSIGTTEFAYVQFSLENGRYDIAYDWRCQGRGGDDFMRVAVVPASTDFVGGSMPTGFSYNTLPTDWIAADGGSQLWNQSQWTTKNVSLTLTNAGDYYLVFVWHNHGGFYDNPPAAVDNIRVEKWIITTPTELAISNITTNSAKATWHDTDASAWNLRYKKTSQSEWNTISALSQKEYTLTGLDSGTEYEVQVQAVEDDQQSAWTASVTFCTKFAVDINHPYMENFEGSTLFQFANGNTGNKWYIGTAAYNGSGTKGLYISNDNGNTNAYVNTASIAYAYVPIILEAGKHEISYDWKCKGESSVDYMRVVLVSASVNLTGGAAPSGFSYNSLPQGWIALDGGSGLNLSPDWSSKTARLTISDEGDYYLVFVWRNDGSQNYNPPAAIDNILVAKVNAFTPSQLAVSDITTNSAKATWADANGSAWNLRYKKTSESTWNTINDLSQKEYTFSNLDCSSEYEVQVQATGSEGQSAWTASAIFNTNLIVDFDHPYAENFEGSTLFQFANGTVTNKWYIGTAAHNGTGSTKGLYISNNNGSSNDYNKNAMSTVYAYVPINLESGNYVASYDWICYGETTLDFLRVALVPASTTLAGGQTVPCTYFHASLPEGWIPLDGGSKLNLSSSWSRKTITLTLTDANAGDYYLVFAWRNNSSAGENPPAAIDNISLAKVPAFPPSQLTVSNVMGHSATVRWQDADASAWNIRYKKTSESTWTVTEEPVTVREYTLTGLDGSTEYEVQVQSTSSDGQSAWTASAVFSTVATYTLTTMEEVQAITNTDPYNTYEINVNGWQVTFAHTYYRYNSDVYLATAYFTDGQGHGIMAFDNSRQDLGFVAGDRLSGFVSCNIARDSRGYNVIRNLFSSSTGLTITNDGSTATPFNTTISDIGMAQHGALVSLQDVSSHQDGMYKFFDETDGNNSIGCFYANKSPFANHTPNTMYGQLFDRVTGIVLYQNINNSEQFVIYPLSSDDVVAHLYSITLNQTEHGTITCEQTGAIGNEIVYISNVAEEGYELYGINVYKADDPSETVYVYQGNSYYFYMPTYDVIVEPVFGEAKHNINCDNNRYFGFTDLNGRSITRAATGEWVKITTYYYNDYSSYAGPGAFSINGGDVAYYLSPEASTPTQFAFCTTEYYFQMPDGDAYITSTITPYLSFFYMWDYTWNGSLESQRRCYYAPVGVPVTLPQNTYEGYTFERYYLNSSNYPYEEMNECLSDDGRTFTIPYGNIVTVYAFYNGNDVTKYAIDNQATGLVDHRVNIYYLNFSPDEAPAGTRINVNINVEEATDGSVVLPTVITITPDDESLEPYTYTIDPKDFDPYYDASFEYYMPESDVTITANTGTYYKLYQVNTSGSFNLQSLYYVLDRTLYATANEQIALSDYLAEWDATFYEYEILDLDGNPRNDLLVDGILTMPTEPIVVVYHYCYLEYTYNVSIDPEISDYITITSTLPAASGTRVTFTTSDGLSFYPGYELGVADYWGNPLPMSPAYSPDIHEYYFYITENVTIAPVEIPRYMVNFFDSYGDDPDDWDTAINDYSHEYQRGSVINITPREHYGFTFMEYQAVKYNYSTGKYDDITSQVLSGNATDGYTLTMPDYDIILWGRYTPTPGFQYKITYVKWLPDFDIEMDVPVVEYAEAGETVTFSFPDDYSYARFLPDYGFDIYQDANWNTVNYENNTFTMPLGDVTVRGFYELTDPIVLVRVNGELKVVVPTEEEGAKTMAENNSIDLTPYIPAEAPASGFEFYKWYKNVNGSNYIYYDNSWMPDYCFDDTYTPNMFEDDETLTIIDAVFCQNAGMHYQYITEYPENGDAVCLYGVRDIFDENCNYIESMFVGLDANGNSVSMENAFDDFGCLSDSWSDGQDNHSLSDILWIVEGNSEDGYTFRHANQNKFVSVTGTGQVVTIDGADNAAIFQIDINDVYGYVEAIRTSDDKYLGVDENGNFTVYDEFQETGYVDLYKSQPFRKYFTTSIQTESDDDHINEFQGVHVIEGEVYANYLNNYEYNGLIVIKDGGVLNVQEIFNEDPYAIIIEDGGQLVHEYSNMKATVKKHIEGYGNRSADWQLIALPLYNNDENPLNYPIDDFTVGDYDLYAYDEPTRYWISPKAGSDETPLTVLDACRGYLYANADDTELSFSGQMASPNDYPHTELSCEGEGTLNGFNLVGNPYTYNIKPEDLGFARVINEDEYSFTNDVRTIYKLNGSNAIVAQGNDAIIKPCEGFFVKATADDEVLQFNRMYRSAKANPMRFLKIEVEQQNHGRRPQLDRAYLNFNTTRNMEKLVFDETAMRLSLVSEGKDYAALSTSNEGTMPLSFEAAQNGIYTLTVSAERTEATYLHLVDKLTGADIDLLESGSYIFTAMPSDDAMRFEIVFKTK